MSLSNYTYVGDGATKQFSIPFPFLYPADVTAKVNGVDTSFTLAGNTVLFVTAPANGVAVFLQRTTEVATALVDFIDASNIVETDLDTATRQPLYALQELKDAYTSFTSQINNTLISNGDLPVVTSADNGNFMSVDAGVWVMKSTAETKSILGIETVPSTDRVPPIENFAGFLYTDGATVQWSGIETTRSLLGIGDLGTLDVSDLGTAAFLNVGTAVADVLQLTDIGSGVPGLPAINGSLLTAVPQPLYIRADETQPAATGGGLYSAVAWTAKTLNSVVVDETAGVSVSGGALLVNPGKYAFRVKSRVNITGFVSVRLKLNGAVISSGNAVYNSGGELEVEMEGKDDWSAIAVNSPLTVEVFCSATGADTTALGKPHNDNTNLGDNHYTTVELWKLPS